MKEQNNPASSLRRSIRQHWIMGSLVVAVCFFGTGIWASFAELSSAAIAAGKVSPDGSLRVVQHLEGGIVRHLNVKEGDVVKDGQLLMVLDQALATANYLSIYRKHQRYVVTRDRLLAQERGDETFEVQMRRSCRPTRVTRSSLPTRLQNSRYGASCWEGSSRLIMCRQARLKPRSAA